MKTFNIHVLQQRLTCVDRIRAEIAASEGTDRWSLSHGFLRLELDKSLLEDQPIFRIFGDLNPELVILRMDPFCVYNWHVDASRSCAINCLINHDQSASVVRRESKRPAPLFDIETVPYDDGALALMNTQAQHMVTNFGSKPRDVMSIGFFMRTGFSSSFAFVRQYCIEHGL